ncbi:MAG: DUF2065 domain-containing protein, partial [Gammaproteobacteria bacterium]|nr:DUF2065 domain-containing protein [Gammaproteobacteria bacterium]
MIWSDIFAAFALYLVFEGLMPFVSPASWRKSMLMVLQFRDGQLRWIGLISVVVG